MNSPSYNFSSSSFSNKNTPAFIGGGVLILIVIGLVVAIIVVSVNAQSSKSPYGKDDGWPPGAIPSSIISDIRGPSPNCAAQAPDREDPKCTEAVCGGGSNGNSPMAGCCGVYNHESGRCEKGQLTAGGCNSFGSPMINQLAPIMNNNSAAFAGATAPDPCQDLVCSGSHNYPGCCAVSQHGTCVQGVVTNGMCKTQVQQTQYEGWGAQMPNTYLISSSGPKVGATVGSCDVRPMTSGLQNYVGLFENSVSGAQTQGHGQYSSGPVNSGCRYE